MSQHTLHTLLYLDDEEIPVEVDYNYWPSRRGARDKYGAPEEPDDPEEIEILEIRRYASASPWNLIEVPPAVMKTLESEIWEHITRPWPL